jgi:hypothetical protein
MAHTIAANLAERDISDRAFRRHACQAISESRAYLAGP